MASQLGAGTKTKQVLRLEEIVVDKDLLECILIVLDDLWVLQSSISLSLIKRIKLADNRSTRRHLSVKRRLSWRRSSFLRAENVSVVLVARLNSINDERRVQCTLELISVAFNTTSERLLCFSLSEGILHGSCLHVM